MTPRAFLAVASIFVVAGGASAEGLDVGDPAPKLEVKEFVKGKAVDGFEKGKVYVVEFWATWCGPCKATIPHLTELQKKHEDVTFIGVSILEQDQGRVAPFVEKMGDKMGYRVALDKVPEGKEGSDGAMALNWMRAAQQKGIPTAFVVDGGGKIAWIGHPTELDGPLEKIVAGKYDVKKVRAQQRTLEALGGAIDKARKSGKPKEALEGIDKALADDSELEARLGVHKFCQLAGKGGRPAEALDYGGKLLEGAYKDDGAMLNFMAWAVVDPEAGVEPDAKLAAFAVKAARAADALEKGKNGDFADTLARAYFVAGDFAKAVEAEERAVKFAADPEQAAALKRNLAEYKKELQKKGDK